MTNLINGRTPEEIKRWVDGRATCNTCPKEHEVGCEDGERTEDCQMTIDTIAYIECLESERDAALAKVPKWISVKERLPESGVHVFVLCEIRANGGVIRRYVCDGFHVEAWKEKAGCYSEDCALAYNDEDDEYYLEEGWYEVIKNWEEYDSVTIDDFVTHWMPLPSVEDK